MNSGARVSGHAVPRDPPREDETAAKEKEKKEYIKFSQREENGVPDLISFLFSVEINLRW